MALIFILCFGGIVRDIICDALRSLIPFVQLKNVKNTHGGVLLLVKLHASAKATLLHGCFTHF